MDLIYKLDLVLTAVPLPELRKIAETCQKQEVFIN